MARQPGLRADLEALFENLSNPATLPAFFDRVSDDVQWTVEGVHPIAGTYTSKADLLHRTFGRLAPLMRQGSAPDPVDSFGRGGL